MSKRHNKIKGGAKKEDYSSIPIEYLPFACKLKYSDKEVVQISPQVSESVEYPRCELGFQHFLHQNKEKMGITESEKFKGKKKVYLVLHPFEKNIDEYEFDINHVTTEYFKMNATDGAPSILSRAFYKLWEILMMYDIVPLTKSFTSVHLAEAPGSFIQATLLFKETFGSSNKDKHYAISIKPPDETVPAFDKNFMKYYSDKVRVHQYTKDDGDMTKKITIDNFCDEVGEKVELITADGGFNWKNESIQEQEAMVLIVSEIITALRLQEKGGAFVCKIYETHTLSMCKLICMLSSAYKEIYITKPLFSHPSNSEKYIVCKDYVGSKKLLAELEFLFDSYKNNPKKFLTNLFPTFELPKEQKTQFTVMNTTLSNKQLMSIKKILEFIHSNNYYGEVYQENRKKQIDASKYWLELYYPMKKEIKESQKKNNSIVEYTIDEFDKKCSEVNKKLT